MRTHDRRIFSQKSVSHVTLFFFYSWLILDGDYDDVIEITKFKRFQNHRNIV